MLQLLEHYDGGALGNDKAVAGFVKRPAADSRLVVEGVGQRPGPPETGEGQRVIARLGAAGHHDVGLAHSDEPRRIPDRVRARGAGRRGGMVRTLEAVSHRDVTGGQIDEDPGYEQRRYLPIALYRDITQTDSILASIPSMRHTYARARRTQPSCSHVLFKGQAG